MMTEPQLTRISKTLSFHLRHRPDALGLTLGPGGWVAIDTLLAALARHGRPVTRAELDAVVARNPKQRFAFDEAGATHPGQPGPQRHCDHVLSKQIVQSASPGATIVLENLTDIRTRSKIRTQTKTSRRVHCWSFAQITSFVAYEAEGRGCTVVGVDPRHTSQTCSCCGHKARNNRRSRGRFVCRGCGFELHADLNAARNIAATYHASGGRSPAGGLPVN